MAALAMAADDDKVDEEETEEPSAAVR